MPGEHTVALPLMAGEGRIGHWQVVQIGVGVSRAQCCEEQAPQRLRHHRPGSCW